MRGVVVASSGTPATCRVSAALALPVIVVGPSGPMPLPMEVIGSALGTATVAAPCFLLALLPFAAADAGRRRTNEEL